MMDGFLQLASLVLAMVGPIAGFYVGVVARQRRDAKKRELVSRENPKIIDQYSSDTGEVR